MPVMDWIRGAAKRLFAKDQRTREVLRKLDRRLERLMGPPAVRHGAGTGVDTARPFGLNVAGYFLGDFGVAEAARADARAIEGAGIPYALNNVAAPGSREGDGAAFGFSKDNPYRYNLVHLNAEQVNGFYRDKGEAYFGGRYNIGYWVWELEDFRAEFVACFGYYDEIWTPSRFCADAMSKVSPVPVVRMPHAVDVDAGIAKADRGMFGLSEDEFVFGFMFDFQSIFDRKNPLAIVNAFKAAFGEDGRVRLVIKHLHSERYPIDYKALRDRATGGNVTLLDGRFSRHDVLSFFASCDCYVSLHRSEGFGLTIAEAMALGKPVIATGYSGNMDFMDTSNSFPVDYTLVRLEREVPPYPKGGVWAEPDTAHAARLMKAVFEDKPLRDRVGMKAKEDIVRLLSPSAVGRLYKDRLDQLERQAQNKKGA